MGSGLTINATLPPQKTYIQLKMIRQARTFVFFLLLQTALCSSVHAERHTLSFQIVDGDVDAARIALVRELFNSLGQAGDLSIRSTAASINGKYFESTIATSRAQLRRFSVLREEITDQKITMVFEVERSNSVSASDVKACEPPLFVPTTALRFHVPQSAPVHSMRQAIQDYFNVLHHRIASVNPMVFAPLVNTDQAAYFLDVNFEPRSRSEFGDLYIQLVGADGIPLWEKQELIDLANLRVRNRTSLGYADLVAWQLSRSARQQIEDIVAYLSKRLFCLPLVVRIPASQESGGGFSARQNPRSLPPAVGFFASKFPINRGLTVDLLKLERFFEVVSSNGEEFTLQEQQKATGSRLWSPGGFVVLH